MVEVLSVKLTPEQIEILRKCENGVDVSDAKKILEFLIETGFCDPPSTLAQTKIYSNQAGKAFLYTYDELQKQIKEQDAQKRADQSRQTKREILIAFASFVGAFIVEYLFDIIGFVRGLFGA